MKDVLGKALMDWHSNKRDSPLMINNKYGDPEEMPVQYFFRSEDAMPDIEQFALTFCNGRVADIGAGAGAHALALQAGGLDSTSFEVSSDACNVMKARGVKNIENIDIFNFIPEKKFDTLLLLMNGIGIAGDLKGLRALLSHFKKWLIENGQIIFDSSDIAYLYEDKSLPANRYYGEVAYQYAYKGETTSWFNWLYIDFDLLSTIAQEAGYTAQILFEDETSQYLCRLTVS